MRTFCHRITIYFTLIAFGGWYFTPQSGVDTIANPFHGLVLSADTFELQVFDAGTKMTPPYRLISGKRYRLQAVQLGVAGKVLPGQWFLAGNLGRITETGERVMLTAVFVGEGSLICRVADIEQRVKLSVVPATETINSRGGKLQSPAGVEIALPPGALAVERKIGIEIVASPGLPPATQRVVRVIQISPAQLVLKRPARLTFLLEGIGVRNPSHSMPEAQLQLYFWEAFGRKWVPLQGRVNTAQGGVTTAINHFGIYTLMVPGAAFKRTDHLQIQNVTLSPRVFFAPDTHRLTIQYLLNAPDATQAFVTMDIFDFRGKRVRQLLADAPRYTGQNAAQWDGLTDNGTLVRNGRYLLVIRARTGSQRVGIRKLIVVFK